MTFLYNQWKKFITILNSTSRFKIIERHKTELKSLQTPFLLRFNDNLYHEGNILKIHGFDIFPLLECRNRKTKSHGVKKNAKYKHNLCAVKRNNI